MLSVYRFLLVFLAIDFAQVAWSETHTQDAHATSDKHTSAESKEPAPKASSDTQAKTTHEPETKHEPDPKSDSEKKPAKETSAQEGVKALETKPTKILPSDVRVLIDISGSMKQTDPQNLRKPALDLIVRLLPDKSRAGVWTFGNDVNMLVPRTMVDANWRKQAAPKSEQINSIALFTNIGKALDTVSFDKKNPPSDYKNHIILLTDGMVDIDKDPSVNVKERQRILAETLPTLKKAGYIVHSIALSKNSDAELLKKISTSTDGVFLQANTADELMSAFLKIFDQAVPAERVPIEHNGFMVDASVKEFTALIFRKPGVEQTIIASPDGKEYSETNPHDGINLYHTDKYDLITVENPKVGQWKIKTEISPESRVTVVSNLQLTVQGLKNNIKVGDILNFEYSFQENGKTITNKDFLGVLDVNAIIAKDKTEENVAIPLTSYNLPEDGIFHQIISTFSTPGEYELHLYIDGKTFKREFKHSVSVRDTLLVLDKTSAAGEHGKVTYTYKITTDEKLVDVKKIQVTASIKNSLNNNMENTLNLKDGNHWEFSFSPAQEAEYTIDIHGQGETIDGDKLDETIHADKFTYPPKAAKEEHPKEEVKNEEPKKDEPKKEEPKAEEKPAGKSSNLLLYISIGLGNLLLIGAGYFIYKNLMGSKAKNELEEYEKTLAMESLPEKKPVAPKQEPKPQEKTEIDLSEEEPANIPMNDDSLMDNLFPLDNMEEPKKDDDEF